MVGLGGRGVCMVALGGVHGCSKGACMVALGVCVVALGACVVALGGMGGWSGGEGGCAWLLWGACVVALGGMHVCSQGACMVALGGGHAWDTTRYGDMVNEQVVHILLECILVLV